MTVALCRSLQLGVRGGHAGAVGTGHSRRRAWMPLGARELRRGSQYPPTTTGGGRVATLKGRGQLGHFVQFKMKHRISFLHLSKALCLYFYRMTSNQQWKSCFQSKITLVFLKQFSPFFRTRLLADLINGFGLPKAAFSFIIILFTNLLLFLPLRLSLAWYCSMLVPPPHPHPAVGSCSAPLTPHIPLKTKTSWVVTRDEARLPILPPPTCTYVNSK